MLKDKIPYRQRRWQLKPTVGGSKGMSINGLKLDQTQVVGGSSLLSHGPVPIEKNKYREQTLQFKYNHGLPILLTIVDHDRLLTSQGARSAATLDPPKPRTGCRGE